jgi:hypothetical protein
MRLTWLWSVLLVGVLAACGTLLELGEDPTTPTPDRDDAAAPTDGGGTDSGGACLFDDPSATFDGVCGFGP